MNESAPEGSGWFADLDPDDVAAAATAITEGRSETPRDWPAQAIEAGFATDEDDYYERLHEAAVRATRDEVHRRERADDQQLKHAVRAMDDAERTANELAERVEEWGGTLLDVDGSGIDYVRQVADVEPETPAEDRLVALADRTRGLVDERDALRAFVEERAPAVAPNLSHLAGPVLAARLIALAGGLQSLARMSSSTVQVLGAEDALFAHLSGDAPPPKHGVIYTHEYVRGTRSDDRGSAARAVAGKLTIAARIDHYAGDHRPELADELQERIRRIRARSEREDDT